MQRLLNGMMVSILVFAGGCFGSNNSRLRGIVFINEFMASNASTAVDEKGDYDDWIEIYNAGDSAVDLAGMYLTDNYLTPAKWKFPDTIIDPGEFLVIWADNETGEGPLHANFKISAQNGEEIGFYDTEAKGFSLIDAIRFEAQTADKSYGRYPDGEEKWQVFATPTPGKANGLGQ